MIGNHLGRARSTEKSYHWGPCVWVYLRLRLKQENQKSTALTISSNISNLLSRGWGGKSTERNHPRVIGVQAHRKPGVEQEEL